MKILTATDNELRELIAEQMRAVLGTVQVKPLEPLYTMPDACKLLNKDERTLYRWAKHGTIKIAAFDGSRYVTGASIAAVINQ